MGGSSRIRPRRTRVARWRGPRREERPMASRLNPYISFDGNAREAMETYPDVGGGELTRNQVGRYGASDDDPGKDKGMHAQPEAAAGVTLMASDMPPGM